MIDDFGKKGAAVSVPVPEPSAGPRLNPELWRWVEVQLTSTLPMSIIAQTGAEKFSVSERTIYNYIQRVREAWQEANGDTLESRRAKFLGGITAERFEAFMAGDMRAVAALRKVEARVAGVEAPREVKISGGLRPVEAMTPAERRAEILELRRRREAEEQGE